MKPQRVMFFLFVVSLVGFHLPISWTDGRGPSRSMSGPRFLKVFTRSVLSAVLCRDNAPSVFYNHFDDINYVVVGGVTYAPAWMRRGFSIISAFPPRPSSGILSR